MMKKSLVLLFLSIFISAGAYLKHESTSAFSDELWSKSDEATTKVWAYKRCLREKGENGGCDKGPFDEAQRVFREVEQKCEGLNEVLQTTELIYTYTVPAFLLLWLIFFFSTRPQLVRKPAEKPVKTLVWFAAIALGLMGGTYAIGLHFEKRDLEYRAAEDAFNSQMNELSKCMKERKDPRCTKAEQARIMSEFYQKTEGYGEYDTLGDILGEVYIYAIPVSLGIWLLVTLFSWIAVRSKAK